eukprot:355645-Chlamydomonas_euryale.AAC.11
MCGDIVRAAGRSWPMSGPGAEQGAEQGASNQRAACMRSHATAYAEKFSAGMQLKFVHSSAAGTCDMPVLASTAYGHACLSSPFTCTGALFYYQSASEHIPLRPLFSCSSAAQRSSRFCTWQPSLPSLARFDARSLSMSDAAVFRRPSSAMLSFSTFPNATSSRASGRVSPSVAASLFPPRTTPLVAPSASAAKTMPSGS